MASGRLKMSEILALVLPVVSAILVAVFNNWEKINPTKKQLTEIQETAKQNKSDIAKLSHKLERVRSSQKTELQTQILNKCKEINAESKNGHYAVNVSDYTEDMKQLIILYREYYMLGFNHYGQTYFEETYAAAKDLYPHIAVDLMQQLFPEYKRGEKPHDY